MEGHRRHRRSSRPPRVRLLGPQGEDRVPHLPCPDRPPLPAGGQHLRAERLPQAERDPDRPGQDEGSGRLPLRGLPRVHGQRPGARHPGLGGRHPRAGDARVLPLPRHAAAAPRLRRAQGSPQRDLRDVPQPAHPDETGGDAQDLLHPGSATAAGARCRSMPAPSTARGPLQCTLCHSPHAARVDASDCVGCHQRVRDYAPGRRALPAAAVRYPQGAQAVVCPRAAGGRAGTTQQGQGRRAARGRTPRAGAQRPPRPAERYVLTSQTQEAGLPDLSPQHVRREAHIRGAARLPDLPSPESGQERLRQVPRAGEHPRSGSGPGQHRRRGQARAGTDGRVPA